MKLKEKFAYYKLRKKAAAVDRRVELPHPDTVRKVGVLWQPSGRAGFQYLHDHFSHAQVIFRNLCVFSDETNVNAGSNIITPKDLNWLGFPKPGPAEDFIKTEFDLLLNIALEQTLLLDYLTALSVARFKIGWSPSEKNYFDLNINISRKQDALYLAEQQIFYLGQLNKKTKI